MLLAALAALYLWVHTRNLDIIEQRILTRDHLLAAVRQHLVLVVVSTTAIMAIAVPLGVLLSRPAARRIAPTVNAIAVAAQSIPSFGLIVLFALTLGLGPWYAIYALIISALLPVLANTTAGLEQVDPRLKEAASGIGMSRRQVLWRIELPLAVPVILAGVRTAVVWNVGTATVASFAGAGGLGSVIAVGLIQNRDLVTLVGAALTAFLAIFLDHVARVAHDLLTRAACERPDSSFTSSSMLASTKGSPMKAQPAFKPRMAALITAAVISVALTGCSGAKSVTGTATGGSVASGIDLKGVSISVGSKEYTEQRVLGQIIVQALKATGATVKDQTGLSGTKVARAALTSGQIDTYYEYTGTGWLTILQKTQPISDPQQLFTSVRDADAANKISWFALAPMNDTYAVGVTADGAKSTGVKTISEYAKLANTDPAKAKICSSAEFTTREDGLPGLEKKYGFNLPESSIFQAESTVEFEAAKKGECNFLRLDSTDARILKNGIIALTDDKNFFPYTTPPSTCAPRSTRPIRPSTTSCSPRSARC